MSETTLLLLVLNAVAAATIYCAIRTRRVERSNKRLKSHVRSMLRMVSDLAGVVADQTGSPEVAQKARALAARLRAGTAEDEPREPAVLSVDPSIPWEHAAALEQRADGWRDANGDPLDDEHRALAQRLCAEADRNGWKLQEAA